MTDKTELNNGLVALSFVNSNKTVKDALPKTHALGMLIETRLHERYPDLEVKFESQDGYKLNFNMSFNNRPTSESDVRTRFFDWLKDYPSIKIQELNLTFHSECSTEEK